MLTQHFFEKEGKDNFFIDFLRICLNTEKSKTFLTMSILHGKYLVIRISDKNEQCFDLSKVIFKFKNIKISI